MLNKKFSASVLALSVLLAPAALPAQVVKVPTGSLGVLAPGLGAAGSAPSFRLTDVSPASPLTAVPRLAAPFYPAAAAAPAAAPIAAAAAVPPQNLAKPAAAAQPVSPRTGVRGALDAVKDSVGALFARKESAPKAGAQQYGDGSRMFDGSRRLLAAALTAAVVCAGGCSSQSIDAPPADPGSGYVHLDDRPASAQEAAAELNNTLDGSEAFAAKLGYNTWDQEYHLGVPHRNDFDVNSAHHYAAQQGSFEAEQVKLSAMPVDQAVGAKLVYIDGAWALIADDSPSDYWVSQWGQVTNLNSAEQAQTELNSWLTSSEAFDAKITGDDLGAVRLTYPADPLSSAADLYWSLATFDTYLEAMVWAQDSLDAYQNRGMKVFFSPYDVNYVVLYPVAPSSLAQKLGTSQAELDAAIRTNSTSAPLSGGAALHKGGRTERVTVNWKGVFSDLKKQAPAPLAPASRAAL
jgi:hypothetical protein